MAQGTIKRVTILPNGYQAEVEIEDMGQSGSINTGFPNFQDTLFTSSSPTFNIAITGKSFDDVGQFTYITRSIVGTKFVRMPFPSNSFADHRITGSNVIVKVHLSDFFYSEDTGSISINAGFYTSGSGISSSFYSSPIVENSSSAIYPLVIGNWYWPTWDVARGSTYPLRMGAFHRSAQHGRPVRTVKFIATDASGNTVSAFVTASIIDSSVPDAVPVIEYVWNMPLDTLTQGQMITCSFEAYPWYGNNNSVLKTANSPYSHSVSGIGTPYYANTYVLNDKNNTYGITVCVVDVNEGSDTTGLPIDSQSFDVGNPPPAFRTIGKAASSASAYNNAIRGRNDAGAALILLKEGEHRWMGSTNAYGNIPGTYCIVKNFPTAVRENIKVSGSLGSNDISDRVKLQNISITHTGNGGLFNGINYLWVDNCYISASGAATFFGNRYQVATHNTVDLMGGGFSAFAGTLAYWPIVRGNYFRNKTSSYPRISPVYTYIGNLGNRNAVNTSVDDGGVILTSNNIVNIPSSSNVIVAYNKFYKLRNIGNGFSAFYNGVPGTSSVDELHGCAIVQNVFENVASNSSFLLWVSADGNPGTTINHVLSWHNVLVGQRQNWGYNDSGSSPKFKPNWDARNNYADDSNTKGDWFTGYGSGDANRIGNWNIFNGVGHSGNFWGNVGGIGAAFLLEFAGINCVQNANASYSTSFAQFIARSASNSPASNGTGGGDYHLSGSSPFISLGSSKYSLVIPFDIEGTPRTADTNFLGAYAFGYTPPIPPDPPEPPTGSVSSSFYASNGPAAPNHFQTIRIFNNRDQLVYNDPYIQALMEEMDYLRRKGVLSKHHENLILGEISGRAAIILNRH